jgi:hypothetical protein
LTIEHHPGSQSSHMLESASFRQPLAPVGYLIRIVTQ